MVITLGQPLDYEGYEDDEPGPHPMTPAPGLGEPVF